MPAKPKVAFYWCASCGGCEEAVVDLAEGILDVVAAVDIVFWPVALDFKVSDVDALPDGSIFASFINGAVRLSEQEEMAHVVRRKSKVLVAFGACASAMMFITVIASTAATHHPIRHLHLPPAKRPTPRSRLPVPWIAGRPCAPIARPSAARQARRQRTGHLAGLEEQAAPAAVPAVAQGRTDGHLRPIESMNQDRRFAFGSPGPADGRTL